MRSRRGHFRHTVALSRALVAGIVLTGGCGRSEAPPPRSVPRTSATIDDTVRWRPAAVGAPITSPPWIAHVNVADLDRDGRADILACEAKDNPIAWIRQLPDGSFEEKIVATGLPGPVHVEPADIDGDGDLDLLIAVMGFVFPNNDRIGAIVILENDGRQNFTACRTIGTMACELIAVTPRL